MIETVAHEKFYKDVKHEPLRLVVLKDPRTHRTASPPPVVAPSCSTHSGGASSSSVQGSRTLKMFQGICGCASLFMSCMSSCPYSCCYTILSLDYTHIVRHPTFCKIVQKSSHISLSVNCVLFIPCISLVGAPCTKLENKTLLCLIVEKL
jgi:hypothetical protein